MGKKYIVELEDGEHLYKTTKNSIDNPVINPVIRGAACKPYTEPDLEQVRKEAYEDGYENGFIAGHLKAEKSGQSFYEDGYQRGLADAWEAARKISLAKIDGGFSWESMNNMFGTDSPSKIYKTFTVSEAIEKIRQYEQKQEEIHLGDEVISPDGKAVVTEISDRNVRIMYSNGSGYITQLEELTKTGRHFSEIAAVLEKMRGEQDG